MFRRCLVAACVAALVGLVAPAQEAKGRKAAVVVGVNEYERDLSELDFAENDAEEMAKELTKAGFTVTLLTTRLGKRDAARMPTAANIRKAVAALVKDREKPDTVMVCLAGHGVQLEVDDPLGKESSKTYAYFCPRDYSTGGIRFETGNAPKLIPLNWVFAEFEGCDAGRKIVLVDACRNMGKAKAVSRYINAKKVTVPDGVCAMFSCSSGQVAYEIPELGGRGHGAFFHHVLQGLRGKAKNVEGAVTWGSLTEYVAANVEKTVYDAAKKRQTPHQVTNVIGSTPVLVAASREKWVSLFDGKTLKGWKTHPDTPGEWKVVGGAITCSGSASHLFTERATFRNFRVRAEVMINARGNSGLYFRTAYGAGFPSGWEAQMSLSDPWAKTGSLYPVARHDDLRTDAVLEKILVTRPLHEPDEWFTYEVEAVGPKITIRLDGKKTVEWTDPKDRFTTGRFAIQHVHADTVVKVRKIEVMELPDEK